MRLRCDAMRCGVVYSNHLNECDVTKWDEMGLIKLENHVIYSNTRISLQLLSFSIHSFVLYPAWLCLSYRPFSSWNSNTKHSFRMVEGRKEGRVNVCKWEGLEMEMKWNETNADDDHGYDAAAVTAFGERTGHEMRGWWW